MTVPRVHLKLLTKKDLNAMKADETKNILLVNPRKAYTPNNSSSAGYALGRSGSEDIGYNPVLRSPIFAPFGVPVGLK